MIKFALAGNPNCGKTTLFNALTGSTAHVGNWPGVTVDKKEGVYKKCAEPIEILDLPGIYSLSPYTPEEVIARNYILDEKPDLVINIVDATNLERNLYLTTQLMEIEVPVVVALNMMDAVEKAGDKVSAQALEDELAVPVVEISALKGKGIKELMDKAYAASKRKRDAVSVLGGSKLAGAISEVKALLYGSGVKDPLFHAIKLVESDELEVKAHPEAYKLVEEYKTQIKDDVFGDDFEAIVADERYKYISKHFAKAFVRKNGEAVKLSKSDKADRVLTHRIWGIPIFAVIMFLVFHLTFSEDFLYLGAAGALPENWVTLAGTWGEGIFGSSDGISSPGVILFNLLDTITASISDAIAGAMESTTSAWAQGLVVDGIFGGLFAVLSFLPQILVLFMFFSILEDSGYMARVAFILDRIFRRFGLSGRAFMPMIMGFGCSIPAMINTRTLADDKERMATIRVIPFFSCGAKLPILVAIAGGIVQFFGVGNSDAITYGMYILGIAVAIIAVIVMRNTTMRGDTPPFIMELPAYHAPQAKALGIHLWDKTKHFVKKAFTIILASTILIWFLLHFSWNWSYLPDEEMGSSILAGIGQLIQPLFTPLGFGSQLGAYGWVFVVAAVMGLIAKENVIAGFGTMAAVIMAATGGAYDAEADAEGITAAAIMIEQTGITIPALISFIAFNMTTIPCFAAVATAKAELGSKKNFRNTLIFWLITSYIVGTVVYLVGSWWWTVFIFLAIAAGAVYGIVTFNRKRDAKAKLAAAGGAAIPAEVASDEADGEESVPEAKENGAADAEDVSDDKE